MAEKGFGVKEINLIGASGTPTIESPNNINLNAVNVAISTNSTVGGNLSVSGTLTGDGSNLTNLPAANLTGTLPAISGANLTNLPAANLTGTLPAISGANLTNLPTVDPATSDIQVAYELLSTSSSSNGYRISGNGVDSSTANPDLYLVRGQKYRFINNSGGTHPFRIQSDNGTTLYSTGVTNNNSSTGNIDFAPSHDAPQQLYYKCGAHPSMLGNIYIVGSFSKISVSGQSDIVVDNLSSTLTFVAGSNVVLATNAATNTITITSTDTNTNTNNYADSLSFNTSNGILTLGRSGLTDLTVDLDGKYANSSHTHSYASTSHSHSGYALASHSHTIPTVYVSTSSPSGGNNGDIWIKY